MFRAGLLLIIRRMNSVKSTNGVVMLAVASQSTLHMTIPIVCNVHGSMHHNNILIYIQQEATLHSLFYLETALHVSGGTTTHHQERKIYIYSIWLLSHRYCYLPLSWKSWNWFECAVGGVRHLQHTPSVRLFAWNKSVPTGRVRHI